MVTQSDSISAAKSLTGAPAGPVKIWAALGVVVIGCIFYSIIMWVTSDHFHPTPVGEDPIPAFNLYLLRGLEVISVLLASGLVWQFLIKPWRQNGEIGWDGMFLIVGFSMWYQDPIDNYYNFVFQYNAYLFNMTSWATYIPGWSTPRQEYFPEPIFLMGGLYIIFMFGLSVLGCNILRKCKESWLPNHSILIHLGIVFITFFLIDLVMESIFCRFTVFTYGGSWYPMTLWAGNYYQFPLYESFVVATIVTLMTSLRYFRDDKGQSWAEKGLQSLQLPARSKKLISFLALMGFCHVIFFCSFFFPFNWISLQADSYPEMPSYNMYGVCGEGTGYACPSDEVPIPKKGSLAISPDDPRLTPAATRN